MVLKNIVFYGTNAKIKKLLRNITIVVIRYSAGNIHNSKPCIECCHMLKQLGVKRVIYSVENGVIAEKVSNIYTNHMCQYTKLKICKNR